jgi:uncharacterized protein
MGQAHVWYKMLPGAFAFPTLSNMIRYLVLLVIFAAANLLNAQTQDQTTPQQKQFVYVLRLVPRLYDDHAWTKEDTAAVTAHFNRLKSAVESGQVIFAGRTLESSDKVFGLVVFEAKDEETAAEFMKDDPAVAAGVMTAELHPFHVALKRKDP